MSAAEGVALPTYLVRESARARRVRLTVTPREGLVVVVPRRFPARRIPAIVEGRLDWVLRALERTREQREALAADAGTVPAVVRFQALGEDRGVILRTTRAEGVRVRQNAGDLVLSGDVADVDACREALRRYCARVARERLPVMLEATAEELGCAYSRASVRLQRTRWGSCSAKGTISLNRNLIFLPPHLVRHVLVHELCHTSHLDHSPAFWARLTDVEPDARRLARELRYAWRHVPGWASDV